MATIRSYEVTITGLSPLLMHWDNIEWADDLDRWRKDAKNKERSKPGDDRSPAFSWIGSLYHDGAVIAMPTDNLLSCWMEGGAGVFVPGGRSGKTFKAQTQSGMLIPDQFWPLHVNGKVIDVAPVLKLLKEPDFKTHLATVAALGFNLFVKRARIGQKKHVRVRPRFDSWSLQGRIEVQDDQLTLDALNAIASVCGQYKGLGDWRPSSRKPGPYGRFDSTVKKV